MYSVVDFMSWSCFDAATLIYLADRAGILGPRTLLENFTDDYYYIALCDKLLDQFPLFD